MANLYYLVVRRVLVTLPVAMLVIIGVFMMTYVLPGNPAYFLLGPGATNEDILALEERMGFNKPIYTRLVIYLGNLMRGDLGMSWRTQRPVLVEIEARFPVTFELAIFSLIIGLAIAIPLGIVSAYRPNSAVDHLCRFVSVAGLSLPVFWIGLMSIYVFYFVLHWAPPPIGRLGGSIAYPTHITGMYMLDSILTGNLPALSSSLSHLMLPSICLALAILAPIARMTRTFMAEALDSQYVLCARANGIRERKIVLDYALRNALVPLITVIGLVFSFLIGSAILVEVVFGWPGLGSWVVNAVEANDNAALVGVILVVSLFYIGVNMFIDILYLVIDPRIRI